jgi:hypothetical protein
VESELKVKKIRPFFLILRLKRPDGELGLGGKGAENGPPGPPFSATFSQIQRETYAVNEVVFKGRCKPYISNWSAGPAG